MLIGTDGENNTIAIDTSKDYKSDRALVDEYEDWPGIPNFGALLGVEKNSNSDSEIYDAEIYENVHYRYDVQDLPADYHGTYCDILLAHGFVLRTILGDGDIHRLIFVKEKYDVWIRRNTSTSQVEILLEHYKDRA